MDIVMRARSGSRRSAQLGNRGLVPVGAGDGVNLDARRYWVKGYSRTTMSPRISVGTKLTDAISHGHDDSSQSYHRIDCPDHGL